MAEAEKICIDSSTDDRQPTGAVVVKDGVIIGRGANQSKLKNTTLKRFHEKGWCVRKLLKVKTGEGYWMCPGCSGYDTHAEPRAINDARAHGHETKGVDLYLWGHWWCCKPCWEKMINAGIVNVYLMEGSEVVFNRSHPNNSLGREKLTKI